MPLGCGLTTPETTDAVESSDGIAPGFSRAHYLSGNDVLGAPASSTDNPAPAVHDRGVIRFGSAIYPPILAICPRPHP